MELTDVLRARKMCRRFDPAPLDEGLIADIVEGALRAPSAGGTDGVDLLVLSEFAARAQFWQSISDPRWLASDAGAALCSAPVIAIICYQSSRYYERYREADKRSSPLSGLAAQGWPVEYWVVDAAFVAYGLLLGAADAGLGALFFHLQGREREALERLGVPSNVRSIGAVALGRALEGSASRRPRRRRDRNRAVHRDRW